MNNRYNRYNPTIIIWLKTAQARFIAFFSPGTHLLDSLIVKEIITNVALQPHLKRHNPTLISIVADREYLKVDWFL